MVPLGVLKINKIWLPWLLIYMIIYKMFNLTDGRDRNFGVDFLLLFCHLYLKNLDSPNIFNYRCYCLIVTYGTAKKKRPGYLVGNLVATNWPIEKALHAIGYNQIPTK